MIVNSSIKNAQANPRLVYIVDDEKDIAELLSYNLQKEGYKALVFFDGESALEAIRSKKPDLVILDWMMPGMDGLEICKILKSEALYQNLPLLMLTAKSSEIDQILALEMGAHDYVSKPFSLKVLMTRVKTLLRRSEISTSDKGVAQQVVAGPIRLDKRSMRVYVSDELAELTKLEYSILLVLAEHPGRVFSRDELLSKAWAHEAFVVDRTVDVHVKSIRKKIGKARDMIQTVRGSGYRLDIA